eukprot:COSAG01_NODE_1_length_100484_cov_170.446142_77_plen_131_part_00
MDIIADLLTVIRNGLKVNFNEVELPHSKLKMTILEVLKKEGFISNYKLLNNGGIKKSILIQLKYDENNKSVIHSIKRISRQSKRNYVKKSDIPKVMNGYGVCILSTSKGVISGRDARLSNIGGELLLEVW